MRRWYEFLFMLEERAVHRQDGRVSDRESWASLVKDATGRKEFSTRGRLNFDFQLRDIRGREV